MRFPAACERPVSISILLAAVAMAMAASGHGKTLLPADETLASKALPGASAVDVKTEITARGKVVYDPEHSALVAARCCGIVWRVFKEPGDKVHQGDVLALVDARDVGDAKAAFLLSLAQFELQSATLARLHAVETLVPEKDMDDARAKQRESRIHLFNNRQALLNLGLDVHIDEVAKLSDLERIGFMRLLGLPETMRSESGAEELTANLLPLVSPIDGQVMRRNAVIGDVVQASQTQPLFVVADLNWLHIDLDVSTSDIDRIALKQRVTFRSDNSGPVVSGVVSRISPEIEVTTGSVKVEVAIANSETRLRPNATGMGSIAR